MAIKLSAAMTQSRSISSEDPSQAVVSATVPTTDNYAATLESFGSSSGVENTQRDISNHDNENAFAQVDFLALDDRITQHQLMTQ